jgi:hypothetical protein
MYEETLASQKTLHNELLTIVNQSQHYTIVN